MSIRSSSCFYTMLYYLQNANSHDSLNPALAQKFGFNSAEELFKEAQPKFSLVSTGIVQKPSCRLLLVNVSLAHLYQIRAPVSFYILRSKENEPEGLLTHKIRVLTMA